MPTLDVRFQGPLPVRGGKRHLQSIREKPEWIPEQFAALDDGGYGALPGLCAVYPTYRAPTLLPGPAKFPVYVLRQKPPHCSIKLVKRRRRRGRN